MPRITINSSFYLDNNELSAFRKGDLEIHCMSMRLERPAPKEVKYLGAGFIRQITSNKFEFVMYSKKLTSATDILEDVFGSDELRPGQLIPKSHYYKLTSIDEQNRKWTIGNILHPNRKASENGTIINGYFDEMGFKANLPKKVEKDYLSLEFLGEHKIPTNISTQTEKTVGGKQVASSSSLNILQFSNNKKDFSLRNEDGRLQVEIRSKQKMAENYETKITEALQFVLGRPLTWSIMVKQHRKKRQIVLKASPKNGARGINPPVNATLGIETHFCNLFSTYLAYICSSESTRIHPISSQTRSITLANSINVETLALVLSVAVEGILKYINTQTSLSESELKSIEDARKYFTNWGGSKRFTARINGLLRSILENPGAKDVLNELTNARITTPRHKGAWDILRNKLAHGGRMGSTSLQEFLDLTNTVLILFYHLVFHIIGYQGSFPDYSIKGWPERNYPLDENYL